MAPVLHYAPAGQAVCKPLDARSCAAEGDMTDYTSGLHVKYLQASSLTALLKKSVLNPTTLSGLYSMPPLSPSARRLCGEGPHGRGLLSSISSPPLPPPAASSDSCHGYDRFWLPSVPLNIEIIKIFTPVDKKQVLFLY